MVAAELAPLKLGHANFRVALESAAEDKIGAFGLEFNIPLIVTEPFAISAL